MPSHRYAPGEVPVKHDWKVLVGERPAYTGENGFEATKTYLQTAKAEREGSGKKVVLVKDGRVVKEQ